MIEQMWVEKYRPKSIVDYVWRDEAQRQAVARWVEQKSFPHLILSGSAGTGKTTLAKVLIEECEVHEYDFMEINASRENSVDDMRDRITNFVQTMPFGDFKVVLLDEADYLSHNAQSVLRGVMETYAESARFILTCNFPHKIMDPLRSRSQGFHIEKLDRDEYTARVAQILITENVDIDLDVLDTYVAACYPDLRKCINSVQQATSNGKLMPPSEQNTGGGDDNRLQAVELFKAGKITQARKLLATNLRPEQADELFRWCYDNLDLWSSTEQGQDRAIIIIRNGLVNHSMVADVEINVSATLAELAEIARSE